MAVIQPKRILVVEDDPATSAMLEKLILQVIPEAHIKRAVSLQDAFAGIIQNTTIADKKPYEFIVADIFLKGNGTGLDLWRVLCATYPHIPFLVISSLSEKNVVAAVGENEKKNLHFLKKPFSTDKFEQKIKSLLLSGSMNEGSYFNIKALTGHSLLSLADKHQQMAHLLVLRLSVDWLEKQPGLNEVYGGANPAQELLFQIRLTVNRLWQSAFSKKKIKLNFDKEKVHEYIMQISELAPELKVFIFERSGAMQNVFQRI